MKQDIPILDAPTSEAIRQDLQRTVAHLARTNRCQQQDIWREMLHAATEVVNPGNNRPL